MQTSAEHLRAAAELIRVRGLCKNVMFDDEGRHCAVGALFETTIGLEWQDELLPFLNSTAAEMFPGQFEFGHADLVQFNNHPDTTAEDVIFVLEKAAARREETVGYG